jgi:hypothetical protein
LLQRYHQARLPQIKPEEQPHLFEVLGSVSAFKDTNATLNITILRLGCEQKKLT